MAKTYGLKFGSGDSRNFTGLSPTFVIFISEGATTISGPAITEIAATGIYKFSYTPSPTFAVLFEADGGAALSSTDRYITGVLDPISVIDQQLGYSVDSVGDASTDPSTVFGAVKRLQEFDEGDKNFNKSTGVWTNYDRGGTLVIRIKTLTNTASEATSD